MQRLFPRIFEQPWALVARNTRCPRCHVHRFAWEVPADQHARLKAGDIQWAVGSGQCERCGWHGTFRIDCTHRLEWYSLP